MRYVCAMVGAIVLALVATLFVSVPLANWVVNSFEFDSPDTVAEDAMASAGRSV